MTRLGASDRVAPRGAAPRRPAPGSRAAAEHSKAAYRRRRLLALGLLVVLLAAGGLLGGRALLLHVGRFQVRQIAVTGAGSVDPELVRAASGVRLGEPLLAVDTGAVRRRVAAIPAVAQVDVSRDWPSTLRVAVTERVPVALAASASGPVLVDATGLAYQAAPSPPPPLPRLAANRVAPDDPATRAGLAVLAALSPQLRGQVQVVTAAGPEDVSLKLAGGKQVRWGSPDGAARKAAVLAALLTQPGTLYDVSAPDLPTVRR